MKNNEFLIRLKQELPRWVAKGLVSSQNEAAILATISNDDNEIKTLKPSFYAFSFLGIILLAVGIILFFASNWQVIPKIVKLALLFGGLWVSFALAGYLLIIKQKSPSLHWFGQLLLFLGVVIFGSNIWLIAQIYHIDAHYPNGILIWSLGAWLVAFLLRQQACIILSLILVLIWSVTESQYFLRSIHWMFIPVYILNILPILKEKWHFSWHVALIILILWLSDNILWLNYPFYGSSQPNYFSYYFGLCCLAALTVWGLSLASQQKKDIFGLGTLQHYAQFFFLLNVFYLSFPYLVEVRKQLPNFSLDLTIIFILALTLSSIWFYKVMLKISKHTLIIGGSLIVALSALLILNYFQFNHSWLALGFNLTFVGFMLWFIAIGYELKDKIYINLSFLFFAFFIVARYFDVFWDLLNRSFFFMGGGVLLLLGSYILEKKRRILTQEIKAQE